MSMKPILPASGEWVGPPVLSLRLLADKNLKPILDGRRRLAEHQERKLTYQPPLYEATSHIEAVKLLIHAGHHERAAEHMVKYAPEYIDKTTLYLQGVLDMTHHKLIPFMQALQPENRHTVPRRAMVVVQAVKRLENLCKTEGRKPTLQELAACLGKFTDEPTDEE